MARLQERLDAIQSLYERGQVRDAADATRQLREQAEAQHDSEGLTEIEDLVEQMRSHLEAKERVRFDTWITPRRYEISTFALGVGGIGALAMGIAAFLPYAEATTFTRIEKNTLFSRAPAGPSFCWVA